MHAIETCGMENIEKGYTGRNVYVRIVRQPLIVPLDNFQINSAKSTTSVQTQITLQHKPINCKNEISYTNPS